MWMGLEQTQYIGMVHIQCEKELTVAGVDHKKNSVGLLILTNRDFQERVGSGLITFSGFPACLLHSQIILSSLVFGCGSVGRLFPMAVTIS